MSSAVEGLGGSALEIPYSDPTIGLITAALTTFNHVLSGVGDLRDQREYLNSVSNLLAALTGLVPSRARLSLTYRAIDSQDKQTPRRGTSGARTLAVTSPVAAAADELQYAVAQGPALSALLAADASTVVVDDLYADARWPNLIAGARRAQLPVRSSISCPLALPAGHSGSLNFYLEAPREPKAIRRGGTDEGIDLARAQLVAHLLTTGLRDLLQRRRSDNLAAALDSNRQIGAAVGVLIARHRYTYDQAYDVLRIASQRLNRKLRDLADEVVLTGALPS